MRPEEAHALKLQNELSAYAKEHKVLTVIIVGEFLSENEVKAEVSSTGPAPVIEEMILRALSGIRSLSYNPGQTIN